MFENLIERADSLILRLEVVKQAYDEDRLQYLPDSQNVTDTDIDGWFDASASIITQAFGENSKQIQKWAKKEKEISENQRADLKAFHPIKTHIYKINVMRGLLVEFQDVLDAQSKKAGIAEIEQKTKRMVKVLFLAANPKDTDALDLQREIEAIDHALYQSKYRDSFDIKQHWTVSVDGLQSFLLRHTPHMVHFSGHGSESGEIILENEDGSSHPVSVRALSTMFSRLKDNIRCVVLNACFSEPQAEAIAAHIECVVGMSNEIEDAAAISFAAKFYQALGYGKDVSTAFKLGCSQLDLENLDDHDIPRLLPDEETAGKVTFIEEIK